MAKTTKHILKTEQPLASVCRAGFTIIEVLIAITIFSIGILAVITMQTTGIGGNAIARHISEQTTLASGQMEQLMGRGYDLLVDGNGNGMTGLNDGGITPATIADGGPIVSPDGGYSIYWNVAANQPIPNLKTIRVIVRHNTGNTQPVTIDFIKQNAI